MISGRAVYESVYVNAVRGVVAGIIEISQWHNNATGTHHRESRPDVTFEPVVGIVSRKQEGGEVEKCVCACVYICVHIDARKNVASVFNVPNVLRE